MHNIYLSEFSRIYKRLMVLEHTIKIRMFESFANRYKKDVYVKLIPYLTHIDKIHNNKIFSDISIKKLSDQEKLQKSFYLMYLSDLLYIFEFKDQNEKFSYKTNLIKGGFFSKSILDANALRSKIQNLIALRNCIAHFNYLKYLNNKTKYIDALNFFEIQMDCNNRTLKYIPKLQATPTIKNILEAIFKLDKDVFKDDRLLCNSFDDIAVCNGWHINKLPSYWTIVKQKYQIEKSEQDK